METNLDRNEMYRKAVEILWDEGQEAEVRDGYSGRGMYGKTVPGIVTGAAMSEVTWAVTYAVMDSLEGEGMDVYDRMEAVKNLMPTREDNMGLDYIYY